MMNSAVTVREGEASQEFKTLARERSDALILNLPSSSFASLPMTSSPTTIPYASTQLPSRNLNIVAWVFQVIAAVILVQTLFFKFAGAEESKYIFTTLGVEPFGRYAAAISELIAAILLLTPRLAAVGAAMTLGVMFGAIGAHVTKLGIVVKDDGGLLFALAITVFISAAVVLFIRRKQLPIVGARLP